MGVNRTYLEGRKTRPWKTDDAFHEPSLPLAPYILIDLFVEPS